MVIFYHGKWEHPGAFLDMYDTTMGTRIKHVSDDDFTHYDFDPWSLSFSDDGRHVILKGNSIDYMTEAKKTRTLLIFDGHGDLIQHPEGIRARSTMSSQAQHSRKQEIYRQLVDSLTPSRERPEKVHDIKMLKDRNKGVYRSGNTLYLFEANTSP